MKKIAEDFLAIDVRRWFRQDLLIPGYTFNSKWTRNGKTLAEIAIIVKGDHLVLSYANAKEEINQPVYMTTSACHLGGHRYWFRCPKCAKRVAKLYTNNSPFACRHCCDLNYQSQHEQLHERVARKAHKMRDRLGWPRGFCNVGSKPKGLHWSTYERLATAAYDAEEQWVVAANNKFPDYGGFG